MNPTTREVRRQVREWRRGRAEMGWGEVVSEVYAGVLSALVLGSMLVSVVLHTATVSDRLCTTEACRGGRTVLPYLAVGGTVLLVLAVARLFGPVFAPPPEVTWMLGSPLGRGRLLAPRQVVATVGALLLGAAVTAVAFLLGGAGGPALVVAVAAGGAAAGLAVGVAAAGQVAGRPWGRVLAWVLAVAVGGGALALVAGLAPATTAPHDVALIVVAAVVVLVVAASALAAHTLRRLDSLRVRDLAPGGALVPGLGGALAGLDLALVHDVVESHRWRARGVVRPAPGGPAGAAVLVRYDLVRLRRRPALVLGVTAAAIVPWTASAVGAGVVTVPLAVVAGFLALLPALGALRVLTRTASIARALPFEPWVARAATTTVPGALALLSGLVASPALARALDVPAGTAVLAGLAVGAGSLASAVRWMTGRPPDYGRPLVSTPAGGVPTNLYGSVLRGFDVALLVSAPLLLSATPAGALGSLALSGVVLAVLWGRR